LDRCASERYKTHMANSGPIQCSVITPEEQVLETQASSIVIPAHDGQIGILKDRAPLLCELGIGILHVDADAFFVDGGFAQVLDNRVTLLTERSAAADQIDRADAEKALAEAEGMAAADERSAEARRKAIQRAKVKLELARP
ncbi:MAG: ATP synthase F1 subunit epsilon, partial [Phycisphaerae bacterium]